MALTIHEFAAGAANRDRATVLVLILHETLSGVTGFVRLLVLSSALFSQEITLLRR